MVPEKVNLLVNDTSIKLDGFVREFVIKVTTGIATTLIKPKNELALGSVWEIPGGMEKLRSAMKRSKEIQSLKLSIKGEEIQINLNGSEVSLIKPFVGGLLRNTVIGMVSPLKGVVQPIDRLEISIEKLKESEELDALWK